MAAQTRSSPWKPYFVPCEPGHSPTPLPPYQPPHSIRYNPEEDPCPDFSVGDASQYSRTSDEHTSLHVAVALERIGAWDDCLRLCKFGRYHYHEGIKCGKGWMRRIWSR
ncbi:hypothetical protein BJV74DRAFT_838436 [Russula compacta]|nr:hypothetical protein BJV74DRAFT_838436 [Russula compacta]